MPSRRDWSRAGLLFRLAFLNRLPQLSPFSTGGNHGARHVNSRADGWVRGSHPSKTAKGGAAIAWWCRRGRRAGMPWTVVTSLRDLIPFFAADSGLTSWAKLCRRSATGIGLAHSFVLFSRLAASPFDCAEGRLWAMVCRPSGTWSHILPAYDCGERGTLAATAACRCTRTRRQAGSVAARATTGLSATRTRHPRREDL
jgi:hypothetical protein